MEPPTGAVPVVRPIADSGHLGQPARGRARRRMTTADSGCMTGHRHPAPSSAHATDDAAAAASQHGRDQPVTEHDIDTPSAAARRRKVAAQRAAQGKAEARRRLLLVAGSVAAVVAVLAGIIIVGVTHHRAGAGVSATSAGQSLVAKLSVPTDALAAAGITGVPGPPTRLTGVAPQLKDGKPQVLYIGADYCPFCGAQRWPLIVALSRFGTFSGLSTASSSPTDVFPSTPTFSFHGATYTSAYLSFTGVETQTTSHAPLDGLTDAQQQLFDTYDAAPYVQSPKAIPFVMFGNRYLTQGASYSPQLLAGKSQTQIAATLTDPHSALGQTIDGNANVFTAALCTLTGGKPGSVCGTPTITKIRAALDAQR